MIGGKSLLFVFIVSLTYTSVFGKYMFEETRLLHNKRKGVITRHFANFRIFALDEFELLKVGGDIVYHNQSLLGNLRTTTKLTTTTSVDWQNTCFPYEDYSTFNQREMTESECLSEFKFGKRDILM